MIEINNLTSDKINKKFFKKIIEKVLKKEKKNKKNLSVALVEEKIIRNLNKKYRKKDLPTDVLTFGKGKKFINIPHLGEMIICPKIVRKNSRKFKVTFKKELIRVLVHGILHLLDFDHEKSQIKAKKMAEKEEYYLKICQDLK